MDFENLSVSVLSDLLDRIVHNNHHRIDVVNIEGARSHEGSM